MLTRRERGRAFHARARAHRPQRHPGGQWLIIRRHEEHAWQTPAGVLPDARNPFEEMPSTVDEDYMQNLIFEGGAPAAGYDPDETQS